MEERGIKIIEETIRSSLSIDIGLKSYITRQKLRLTEAMEKQRLEFAKRHFVWYIEI